MKTIREELTVTRKEFLTPHYIRVYLTGENIHLFENTTIGINNKIAIPPKGCSKVYFPEFDYEKKEWKPLSDEIRPSIRTYTHRGIDLGKKEIWIDFVAHGENGPASAWAMNAEKGANLGVMMKDGKTELYAKAKNYVLVADSTGIPVISAILENLSADEKAVCLLEVFDKDEIQKIQTKADVHFIWTYNQHPEKGSELATIFQNLTLPTTSKFAYVAAEFSTVKEIRNYLRKDLRWGQEELYAYSYWKSGIAEDKSASERRSEKESA